VTRHVTIAVPDDELVDAASFYGCPVVENVIVPEPVVQTFMVKVTSPDGFGLVTEELLNVVLARYWMGGLRRAEVTEVEP